MLGLVNCAVLESVSRVGAHTRIIVLLLLNLDFAEGDLLFRVTFFAFGHNALLQFGSSYRCQQVRVAIGKANPLDVTAS